MRLGNIAIKVPSLADAEWTLGGLPGCRVIARHAIGEDAFLEAQVGDVVTNVFETALYEEPDAPLPAGPLHVSYFVEHLDAMLGDPAWLEALVWGPETIEGGFGRRRIAFFEPQRGWRIELMEDLGEE